MSKTPHETLESSLHLSEEQMAWRQMAGQSLSIPVHVRLKSPQQGEDKWQVGNLAYLVP